MTSQTPPYPYFDGIVYNSSFFTSSTSSGGTVAGSLNYPTAQGVEVFPYGLSSNGITNSGTISTGVLTSNLITSNNNIQATGSITGASIGNTAGTGGISSTGAITGISFDTTTPSTTFNFLTSQSVGINMGTSLPSGQTIQIGPLGSTAGVSVHCSNIDFTNNSINNATSAGSGDLNIANNQVSGTLNIGNQTFRTGNINIGTGGLGGTISIGTTGTGLNSLVCKGSTGSSISVVGPISCSALTSTGAITGTGITGASFLSTGNITSTSGDIKATAGKLIAGTLDAVSDATAGNTALNIGSNVIVGNIVIGNSQTTGDIIIGASDVSGATITIGTSSTATTINGSVNTVNQLTATGGIKTSSLDVITSGGNLDIGSSQLGGAISIGSSKTGGFITLGGSNTGQSVITNSPATFHYSISLDGTDGIGTTTNTYTAGSNKIGYQSSGTGTTIASLTTTISSACITISNIQVGFYIITLSGNITGFSATTNTANPTITGTNATINMTKYNVGSTTSTSGFSYSGPVQITSSTNSITLQFTMTTGTASIATAPTYSYIRIA
jgi:hypothetical protein